MIFGAYLKKTFWENLRDWKILSMSLVFGPFFIYMMYAYFGSTGVSYNVLVLNHDRPVARSDGATMDAAAALIAAWGNLKTADGKPILLIHPLADEQSGEKLLKNRDADVMMVISAGFSRSLAAYRRDPRIPLLPLVSRGDAGNVRYQVAGSFVDYIAFSFIAEAAGIHMPQAVDYKPLSTGKLQSEFDLYVPALLVLAIIMVLFTAAASIIKEVDKGTLARLRLSRLTAAEFLAAVSVNQVLICIVALALTYAAAVTVGYHSSGSFLNLMIVGALSALPIVAIGVLVAAFLTTIFELLTVGVFPFFVLMFFSDCMIPLPKIPFFTLWQHVIYLNDVLPTSLTVKAFNKILNFNASLRDVAFEIVAILALTLFYFAIGYWLFQRRHIRAR